MVQLPRPPWLAQRYTTFNAIYTSRWKEILRFRAPSEFSTCEVCYSFKRQLQDKALSLEQKLGCLQGYRKHLHDQYCDRTCIWTLQSQGSDPQSGILLICTDGLDQAKFALPRHPDLRVNAGLTLLYAGKSNDFLVDIVAMSMVSVPHTHVCHCASPSKGEAPTPTPEGSWVLGVWICGERIHSGRTKQTRLVSDNRNDRENSGRCS